MKRILLALLFVLASPAFAGDRFWTNPDSNGNLKAVVNKGGVSTTALTIDGASGNATFLGAVKTTVCSKSATYTITDTDGCATVLVTAAADVTINMPAASTNTGRSITVKKVDAGSGKAIPTRAGSDTLDGLTTFPLSFRYQMATFTSDGTTWNVTDYPDKYYFHTNDDNSAGGLAAAETSYFSVVAPYTAIYRVTCQFMVYTGTVADNESNGQAVIKTGSATYGSASYKSHGNNSTVVTRTTSRGFGNPFADWTGSITAGDTIHCGVSMSDITGTGGHSQHFFTVHELRRQ